MLLVPRISLRESTLLVLRSKWLSFCSAKFGRATKQLDTHFKCLKISLKATGLVGKRIVEEEQQGEKRAKYGIELIKGLSVTLNSLSSEL